eukprot:gene52782-59210_t
MALAMVDSVAVNTHPQVVAALEGANDVTLHFRRPQEGAAVAQRQQPEQSGESDVQQQGQPSREV